MIDLDLDLDLEHEDVASLTAVILNWNQPGHTIRSAEALIADGVLASQIVIVDNGSSDGSWQRFVQDLRACHLVRISGNLGFARGNNIGASVLPGASYLFVNSDAFVHRPGSVSRLVQELERSDVGVVIPRLLNADLTLQPSVVPAARPAVALARASGLSRLVPNRLQPHWSTHWDHGSSREVECAVGAVTLVRGTLWDELGGFRESTFMYAEDLDLCLRARARGSIVWFCAEAEFVHLGGGSTRWDTFERAERVGRANATMIRDHLSPARAGFTLAVTRAGLAARLAHARLSGNRAAAAARAGAMRGYGSPQPPARAERSAPRVEMSVVRPGSTSQEALEA